MAVSISREAKDAVWKLEKPSPHFALIFFTFWIFFPLGIYLFCKRFIGNKTAVVHNGRTLFRFGIGWLCLGIFYLVVFSIDDGFPSKKAQEQVLITVWVMFIAVSILCIFSGLRLKTRGRRYEAIYGCVMLRGFRQVERIAAEIDCSPELTEKLICQMIERGYLDGLTYSGTRREILLPERPFPPRAERQDAPPAPRPRPTEGRERVVTCDSCGARNVVREGEAAECEYCHSQLIFHQE